MILFKSYALSVVTTVTLVCALSVLVTVEVLLSEPDLALALGVLMSVFGIAVGTLVFQGFKRLLHAHVPVLSAVIGGVLSLAADVGLLFLLAQGSHTDGSWLALMVTAMYTGPIVGVVGLAFGAGLGQRRLA